METDWTVEPWKALAQHNARQADHEADLLSKDCLASKNDVADARREAQIWRDRAEGKVK